MSSPSPVAYRGKLNYSPYASNENIYFVFNEGVVPRKYAGVYSTWTKDDAGEAKAPFAYPRLLILQQGNDYVVGSPDDYYNFRISFASGVTPGSVKMYNTGGEELATMEITIMKND